jgi:hypothetical protein
MIMFTGDAKAVVINQEDFTLWEYERFFQEHHLVERIPEGAQYHILPVALLQTYDLDSLRAAGYEPTHAAVFSFAPQHRDIFEHRSPQQRERYHVAIIGESRLYVVQRQEWFIDQAKADFQS